jgi:hypothetical protein
MNGVEVIRLKGGANGVGEGGQGKITHLSWSLGCGGRLDHAIHLQASRFSLSSTHTIVENNSHRVAVWNEGRGTTISKVSRNKHEGIQTATTAHARNSSVVTASSAHD